LSTWRKIRGDIEAEEGEDKGEEDKVEPFDRSEACAGRRSARTPKHMGNNANQVIHSTQA